MRALARLVSLERVDDVARLLAGDLGHVVHVGERGLVARDAVAADAQRERVFELLSVHLRRGSRLGLGAGRLLGRRLGLRMRDARYGGADENPEQEAGHDLFWVLWKPANSNAKKAGC